MKKSFVLRIGYLLAWVLLFSPPFLIQTTTRQAGYILLSALFFFPLALYRKSLAISAGVLIFLGSLNIFHAQFLGSLIDEFAIATVMRTESHEVMEFLDLINITMILSLLAWVTISSACGLFLWRHRDSQQLAFPKQNRFMKAGIGLLWAGFFLFGMATQSRGKDYLYRLRNFYPVPMVQAGVRYGEITHSIFYTPQLPAAAPEKSPVRTLVVVIGESASGQRWSMLGYEGEDTNQSLRNIDHLQVHKVLANGTNTAQALPYILTGQSAADSQRNAAPSFLDLAKHAGYKTFVFSNSRFFDKTEDLYSQILRRSADVYRKAGNGAHDEVMTPLLEQALADTAPYKLIVLHTYGSHPDIAKRYPASRYPGADAYNNSIRYTSDLLARWIGLIDAASEAPSAMLYVSDHGLSVPPCVESPRHGRDRAVFEVPLAYWANAALSKVQGQDWLKQADGRLEHSTSLAPALLARAQGYELQAAMPQLQDSRLLQIEGRPYAQLFRQDSCKP